MSDKKVSRQRQWQIAQRAQGLCAICAKPSYRSGLCEEHWEYQRQYARDRYRRVVEEKGNTVRPHKPYICGLCGKEGHNRRTCSMPAYETLAVSAAASPEEA